MRQNIASTAVICLIAIPSSTGLLAATRPAESRDALQTTLAAAVDADCDGALWDEERDRAVFAERHEIAIGECVVFRISFRNDSDFPLRFIQLSDPVPRFMEYVADSAAYVETPAGLIPLTPLAPGPGGSGMVVWPFDGALAPGESGRVEFRARFRR